MSHIYLPSNDSRLGELVRLYEGERERSRGVCERFTKELREIDPYLQMERFSPSANSAIPGVRPGYFAVIRHNPGAPPTVIPIEGEHGEFVEPTAQVFEDLKRSDMWGNLSPRRIKERQEKLQKARERQEQRDRDDRVEEIRDRIKAYTSPGVSMASAGPWRYRAHGRRAK